MPGANRRQDALRDEIKGRPQQTYLKPDRKWIMGKDSRIYYYKYFDPSEKVMVEVSVFELDPNSFRLSPPDSGQARRLERPAQHLGLRRRLESDFRGPQRVPPLHTFQATTFPELTEAPDYFLRRPCRKSR